MRAHVLALATAALCIVPLWLAPVVPTTDGPAHLYNAWLLLHFGDPGLQAGRLLQVNAFVPNWGGVGPLVPLLAVLPPALAEKVFFSAIVVVLVLASAALASRLGGDALLAAAAAGVIAHGWLLAAGFTAFLAALSLGTALCAYGAPLLASPAPTGGRWPRVVMLSVGFGLLFFVHLAGAALTAAIWLLLCAAALRADRSPRRAAAAGVPPLVVLATLVAAHWARAEQHPIPPFRMGPAPGWVRLVDLGTGAFWQAYSPLDRPIGAALTLLTLALVVARATHRGRSVEGARWLALGAAAALVAYLVVPWAAGGGAFLTDRLVPLLFLLPLPWATSDGLPARALFRTALVVLLVGALADRTAQYRYWGSVTRSVVELNRDLPEGRLLVQPPLPPLPMAVDPLVHVWGRVAIERRGLALDNYEAFLVGWFPLSFRPEGRALASAWRESGKVPPGAVAVRFE